MEKLRMELDDLQVESFHTGREAAEEDGEGGVQAYYGTNHTQAGCPPSETTCMQIICDCSAGPSDCDATCPNYWAAEGMSCSPHVC